MIDVASTSSLISSHINRAPYILGAHGAALENKRIEDCVQGNIHGNDTGAGFEKGGVEMPKLNSIIADDGSEEVIERRINEFKLGKNEKNSVHMFGYVLKDVITIV